MKNIMVYKGYSALVEFDVQDRIFFGRAIGLKDSITFQGESVDELEADFKAALDHYLEVCEKLGEQPQKPYSGSILLRLPPELHASLALKAQIHGKSLNHFARDVLALA